MINLIYDFYDFIYDIYLYYGAVKCLILIGWQTF